MQYANFGLFPKVDFCPYNTTFWTPFFTFFFLLFCSSHSVIVRFFSQFFGSEIWHNVIQCILKLKKYKVKFLSLKKFGKARTIYFVFFKYLHFRPKSASCKVRDLDSEQDDSIEIFNRKNEIWTNDYFYLRILTFVTKLFLQSKFGSSHISLLGQNRFPARWETIWEKSEKVKLSRPWQ